MEDFKLPRGQRGRLGILLKRLLDLGGNDLSLDLPDLEQEEIPGDAVVAGEDAPLACFRELEEEVGLSLDSIRNGRAVFTVNFGNGFDDYFVEHWNGDPGTLSLQESEVKAVRFASREEIARMTADGTFIPYHPGLMDLLFLYAEGTSIYGWK